MSELATYSIETDHVVLLSFKDGHSMRVPVTKLSHHLAPPDLEKVRAALDLRRDFIRDHMPKVLIVLAAGGLLAAVMAGSHVVADLTRPPVHTQPPPGASAIVRSIEAPAPSASPSAQPKVQGDSTVAVAVRPRVMRRVRSLRTVAPTTVPSQVQLPSPTPAQSPSPTPTPAPDQLAVQPPVPTTAPVPSPTPQIPNQGKVLGDSTGPTPSPAP